MGDGGWGRGEGGGGKREEGGGGGAASVEGKKAKLKMCDGVHAYD